TSGSHRRTEHGNPRWGTATRSDVDELVADVAARVSLEEADTVIDTQLLGSPRRRLHKRRVDIHSCPADPVRGGPLAKGFALSAREVEHCHVLTQLKCVAKVGDFGGRERVETPVTQLGNVESSWNGHDGSPSDEVLRSRE